MSGPLFVASPAKSNTLLLIHHTRIIFSHHRTMNCATEIRYCLIIVSNFELVTTSSLEKAILCRIQPIRTQVSTTLAISLPWYLLEPCVAAGKHIFEIIALFLRKSRTSQRLRDVG